MLKSTHNKSNPNHLSTNTNTDQSYYSHDNNNFLSVNSIWICRDQFIIAESQIGSKSNNKKEKKFVKVFIDKIIQPSKKENNTHKLANSPSFSIYVKKRKYLFHVLFENDLTLLSLTTNTFHQKPLQEIFDLLYAVKSAYLYEDNLTFNDTLTDLHHSYQYKCKSKIILSITNNNKSLLSHSDDTQYNTLNNTLNEYDLYSPTTTQNNNMHMPPIGYNNNSYTSRNTKLSTDTLDLNNLPSPTPSHNYMNTSASPSYSNNSCPFSDTPTGSMNDENDSKLNNIINNSNKSSESNQTFFIIDNNNNNNKQEENICEELIEYFILKKGWMHKLGDRFKTWKMRYFELWSNGLLNYFDNEMKIKKKGALNIVDEVINVQLYSKTQKENNKQKIGEHGFLLTTHDRSWCFVVQKENVRNDWYLLIQTITFNKKIDLNMKFKTLKLRLEKLEFKWERKFKNIEHDIMTGEGYEYNIYQLQYDLNIAVNLCKKCKKEIVYFCGSDIFTFFTSKMDFISSNIEGTLETINGIIHDRNETPFRKRKRNNNQWYTKRKNNNWLNENINNDLNINENIPQTSFEDTQIVLNDKINIQLPSKKLIRAKNALSKKIKLLNVIVYDEYFNIDVDREHTAPLVWKFDEIIKIKGIKGVYYGKKKSEKININDIQQFQFTIFHQSNRRVRFIFNNEKKAYLWYSKLKSLYDKANVEHVPLYYGHEENHQQIGL